jgi:hypothetical protein
VLVLELEWCLVTGLVAVLALVLGLASWYWPKPLLLMPCLQVVGDNVSLQCPLC